MTSVETLMETGSKVKHYFFFFVVNTQVKFPLRHNYAMVYSVGYTLIKHKVQRSCKTIIFQESTDSSNKAPNYLM